MVGVFLGSFDPPHIGHLSIISSALNTDRISGVYVVPALENPWKKNQTPWELRYRLCKEAFSSYGCSVTISDAEPRIVTDSILQQKYYEGDNTMTDRKHTVPSYVLLRYLRDTLKDDILLITSVETLGEINRWNHGELVLKENKFLLIKYVGEDIKDIPESDNILPVISDREQIRVCSTKIRDYISKNRIVHEYLPGRTEELINELNLYKKCQS